MITKLRFSFHCLFHPFDGFWDLKYERRGSLRLSFLFLLLQFLTIVLQSYGSGFIFDLSYGQPVNIVLLFATTVAPVLLFTVANLSITTFLNGEGTFRDVFMVTCYALMPFILIRPVEVILSNVLALTEQAYINILSAVAALWFFILLFAGIMMVHNYEFKKAIGNFILTVIAMLIIAFLLLLFLNLLSEVFGFGYSLFEEFQIRL